jgi:hypothetical protein
MQKCEPRIATRWSRVFLCLFMAATFAHAAIIFDSGLVTFAATGTQFGRIARDGTASDWSGPKPFPGVTGAPAARGFEVITVNSGLFPFLQISLDDPNAALFDAAYFPTFTPVNAGPNFGLDVNYLGDPGSSEPFGNPSFFQIVVAPNTNVLIAINEVNPGGGAGQPFDLLVEGFVDTQFDDTPEPSAIILFGSGIAFFGVLRRKR